MKSKNCVRASTCDECWPNPHRFCPLPACPQCGLDGPGPFSFLRAPVAFCTAAVHQAGTPNRSARSSARGAALTAGAFRHPRRMVEEMMEQPGLHGRHRDKNGELSKKHGNTLVSTVPSL